MYMYIENGLESRKKTDYMYFSIILKFVEAYPLLVQRQIKQEEGGDGVCWKNSGN